MSGGVGGARGQPRPLSRLNKGFEYNKTDVDMNVEMQASSLFCLSFQPLVGCSPWGGLASGSQWQGLVA